MQNLSRLFLVSLATISGLTLGFLTAGCSKEQPVEQEPVVRPVKIDTIGALDEASVREYPGTIRAFQNAEMGFEVHGLITEFLVREGDHVVKGKVLARLDDRDYQAGVNSAKADLRKAEADLTRSLNIYEQDSGAISIRTIDTHRRAVDVADAKSAVARKALEDTKLRAPFSGRMARKLVEDFANVAAKQPVLILQDTSTLEIVINVPERDVLHGSTNRSEAAVSKHSKPQVIVSALTDRGFPAQIKEFATTADPVTRTFAVTLTFDNPKDVNILPGMTARVRAVPRPDLAWSVPVAAAQADENGKSYVWKVDASSMAVSRTPVELGELFGDRVQIKGGVKEGDMVAVSGVTQLREGMKVRKHER
jgi:RND family efflux transporter MFP subunit